MGFLGGDNDSPEPSRSEELANKQFDINQKEIEEKRRSLFQQRLDIIKGQGTETWTPNRDVKQPDYSGGKSNSGKSKGWLPWFNDMGDKANR